MDENEAISAEEGADRVAERWKAERHRPNSGNAKSAGGDDDGGDDDAISTGEDDDDSTPMYICENCGAHVFLFSRTSKIQRTVQESLECSCGQTDTAAVRDYVHSRTTTQVGRLGPDHRANDDDGEHADEIEEDDEWEEADSSVECQRCLQQADEGDWTSEELEPWEDDEDSLYFELRCAECDHEIEFGWSHPDRGGRIWPCESADFNPRMTFPEERFREAWKRRGWLRPERK